MTNNKNLKLKYTKNNVKDTISAYLFLSPAIITFVLFVAGPVVLTVCYLCFTKYNIITPTEFVGLDNFIKLFDYPVTGTIFKNTLKYVVVLVPLHVIIGLLLAIGVSKEVSGRLKYFFRTAIYFPSVVTTASVAIAWTYLYNKDFGVINYFLNRLGADSIPWLISTKWSIPAIAIFSIWKFVGTPFLYYLIGIQNIPDSFYEAATIDGANKLQTFFKITIPLLSPTIFFVITTTFIGAMQIFEEPFLLTNGGPGDSSRTIALFIYEKAFKSYQMGYASAIAVILFIIILLLTLIQFSLQKKWVNYDYE